nr:uncharacterized protein LOC125180890 [Anser cygnoides]
MRASSPLRGLPGGPGGRGAMAGFQWLLLCCSASGLPVVPMGCVVGLAPAPFPSSAGLHGLGLVRVAGRSALAKAEFCFPPVVLTPASPLPSRDPVWNSGPTCRPQPVLAVAPLTPSPFGPRGFLCCWCSGRAAPGRWARGAKCGRRQRCRGQTARNTQLRAPAARGLGPFCPCRVGGCLLPRPAPGVFAVTAADGPRAPHSTVSGSSLGPPSSVSGSARSAACPSLFPAAGDAGGGLWELARRTEMPLGCSSGPEALRSAPASVPGSHAPSLQGTRRWPRFSMSWCKKASSWAGRCAGSPAAPEGGEAPEQRWVPVV